MSEAVVAGYQPRPELTKSVTLPARPEPITLKPSETAVVVVDMQNAYSTEGGYVDLAGFDISGAKGTIANIKKTLDAAREAGVLVVYFQNGWDPDYVEAGGPGSPNWHKSNALKTMRKRPELQGKLLAKGTWDYAIVDELQPKPGDILVPKSRYSGFFNTNMDSVLRARGIRNLVFVGIATNVCVESSLRDAFHLEYFGVMLEDATHHTSAPTSSSRRPSTMSKNSSAGWRPSTTSAARSDRQRLPTRPNDHQHSIKAPSNQESVRMPKTIVVPEGTQKPIAPYSPGALADGILYVSGTLPFDKNNDVVHVGDAAAPRRAMCWKPSSPSSRPPAARWKT